MKIDDVKQFGEGTVNFNNCCCGIAELDGVQWGQAAKAVAMVIEYNFDNIYDETVDAGGEDTANLTISGLQNTLPSVVLFSVGDGYHNQGRKLADLIKKEELGTLHESGMRNNPTGSRNLRVWMWEPDARGLYYWYLSEQQKRAKKRKPTKAQP